MPRVFVVALVCALVAMAALAPGLAKPAAACSPSYGHFTLEDRAEQAEIVIVGEVITEQAIEDLYDYPPSYYESTIRIAATLKGNPEPEITLSPVGYFGPDCSGGPRLPTGERVMLFLSEYRGDLRMFGLEESKYTLVEGEAIIFYSEPTLSREPIPVEDAFRRVAAITGATDEQLAAALAFARDEPAPEPRPDAELLPTEAPELEPLPVAADEAGGAPVLLIVLASAGLAVLVSALIGLRLRRAR